MGELKKTQPRSKKCYFTKTSPRALEKARKVKRELRGKPLSWKERYERNKKAMREFEKWFK